MLDKLISDEKLPTQKKDENLTQREKGLITDTVRTALISAKNSDNDKALNFYNKSDEKEGFNHANFNA